MKTICPFCLFFIGFAICVDICVQCACLADAKIFSGFVNTEHSTHFFGSQVN